MNKFLKNIKYDFFLTLLIIFTMLCFPLAELLGNFSYKRFFLQEELLSAIGYFFIIILIIYFIYNKLINKNKSKLVLSDLFMILSIFFCIVSIIFSKNLNKSLYGERNYSETPLQVLGYFSIFIIASNISSEKYKKYILNTFIFMGFFECIIAFLQNFRLWPVISLFDPESHYFNHLAFGLTEHCNYFAALAIIFTSIFSGKFLYTKNKKDLIIYLLLSIFGCFAALFTYTRLAMVGIFSIIFGYFLLIFLIKKFHKDTFNFKEYLRKIIILTICFIICFITIEIFTGKILGELFNSYKELNSNFEEFGTKRGTIWKVGLSSLKKYPLTGVGFDNYRYSFSIYPEKFGWSQNKGHNEFIHIFVTQGIPSGINYLIFAFYCCWFPLLKILKGDSNFSKSNLTKIFLIALFAYFVQSLFNSSVTNVAPYKWILMGLLLPRIEQKNLIKFKKNN